MKKAITILTNILKGGKILKSLKAVKEILSFLKSLCIIIGSSIIVNTLNFLNSFSLLNSSILTTATNCITYGMYIYIAIQTIRVVLRFIPLIKEIAENPITKKAGEKIKTSLQEWEAIIKAKTEK